MSTTNYAPRDEFRYRKVREIIERRGDKPFTAKICFSVDRATGAQSWLDRRTLVIGYRGMAQTRIKLATTPDELDRINGR
jgi:hypothetical protein